MNKTLALTCCFLLTNFLLLARDAIDLTAQQTSKTLPKRKLTGLIIYETGTVKKGDKSVGVGWQYYGNVGKTANSQVGVMAYLSNGDYASMIAVIFIPRLVQ